VIAVKTKLIAAIAVLGITVSVLLVGCIAIHAPQIYWFQSVAHTAGAVLSNGVVVEMPDNSLFMAYWTSEYIRSMTSSNGGEIWGNDAEFINTSGNTRDFPGGFLVDGSKVWFFFSKIPAADSTDFTDGEIYSMYTENNGSSWSPPGCIWNSGGSAAGENCYYCFAPIKMASGKYIVSYSYSDTPGTSTGCFVQTVLISSDSGSNWYQGGKMDLTGSGHGLTEGTILEKANHDLVCYMRDETTPSGGHIYESLSANDGVNWSTPTATDLDSPRAIQVLTELNNSDWLLVWCEEYSTSHGGRNYITAAISKDEGNTWICRRKICEVSDTSERVSNYSQLVALTSGKIICAFQHLYNYLAPSTYSDMDVLVFDENYFR